MSDRSAAIITIGGRIATQAALEELLAAVVAESGSEYGELFENEEDALDCIRAAADAGTPFSVCDSEAAWGCFPTIEQCCRENDLEFVRSDEGHYAYASTHVSHKDGKDRECFGSTGTGPCIALSLLTEALSGSPEALAEFVLEADRAFSEPAPIGIDPLALAGYLNDLRSGEA